MDSICDMVDILVIDGLFFIWLNGMLFIWIWFELFWFLRFLFDIWLWISILDGLVLEVFNLVMVFLRSILRLMDFGVRICDISSLTVFFEYFIILIVSWCWIFLRFCLLIVINWSFGLMWSLWKVGFFGVIVLINIFRFSLLEYFSFIIVMLKLILGVFFRIIS